MKTSPTKNKKESLKFNVGDRVSWVSQAGGYDSRKEGTVFMVLPAGMSPYPALAGAQIEEGKYILGAIDRRSYPRKEESYIIEVPSKGRGKSKLYWPLVSKLVNIED